MTDRRGSSSLRARSGANQLHRVVDLGAAGDHLSLRVVTVEQPGDAHLTDGFPAIKWPDIPWTAITALVPDHFQHLSDLGAVGLSDADDKRLVLFLQHLAA